jgi:hypothetical protein
MEAATGIEAIEAATGIEAGTGMEAATGGVGFLIAPTTGDHGAASTPVRSGTVHRLARTDAPT